MAYTKKVQLIVFIPPVVRPNISSALKTKKLKGVQGKGRQFPLLQLYVTSFFLSFFPWKRHLVHLDIFPQRQPAFSSAPEGWPPRRLLFPFQLFPLSAYEPYRPSNTVMLKFNTQ